MEAFGTFNGRRVALRRGRRDVGPKIVDDQSGELIAAQDPGSPNAFSVQGGIVRWGTNAMLLDPGEEQAAQEILHGAAIMSPALAPHSDAQIYQEELELEIMRQGVIASASRASSAAGVVTVVMSILGVLAMLGGVVLMLITERTYLGEEHTYFSSGLTLFFIGLAQASFGLMLSYGISTVVQYLRYRVELDALDGLDD